MEKTKSQNISPKNPSHAHILALVSRYKQGEKEVFDGIFNYYCDRLYQFLYTYTNKSPYIEDILQETFIRVAMHIDTLKDENQITSWVFAICRNVAINYKKKENTQQQFREMPFDSLEESPEAYILKEERGIKVREALEKLTEDQQAVILLSRYEGLNYSEIGSILNKSENAIKALVHRAMTRLGELLERDHEL